MLTLKEFLRSEVKPALGCTEPGAVALAVARACAELPGRDDIAAVRVTVSSSIYKNGMAVGIPGTKGARGNAIAAAMGAICGDASLGLEVLRNSTLEDVAKAEAWVRDERVSIYCDPDRSGVYVLASVFTPGHKAVCLIENSHSNVVKTVLDNETTYEAERKGSSASGFDDGFPQTLQEALAMADEIDAEDVKFIWDGITGALGAASGIVEIFLLEYCQWPEKNAGWGAADAMILRDLLPVHSRIFDAVNRAHSVARTRAGELTMLLASSLLSEELCLAKVPDAVKEPAAAAKAAIFVGHDTNIAGVGALIGADWQLPGFAKNEVPPGGALVLSLWQRGKERYVTAEFTGLSLEALHSDADRPVPADRDQISLSHMQRKPGTRPAGECSPEEFADLVREASER